MGKGVKKEIEDHEAFEIISTTDREQFDSFLDDLTSNQEYPDEMEIFTSDIGWHKIKDYR